MAVIDPRRMSRSRGRTAWQSPGHDLTTRQILTRRSLLAGGASLGAAAALPGGLAGGPAQAAATPAVPFGGAIQIEFIDKDPAYGPAFLDHCDLIMPQNELKFSMMRWTREEFTFEPADRLVEYALSHGKTSRGHCFVWWGATPEWLKAINDPAEVEAELLGHIHTVASRYRGKLQSWDVVNEVIANDPLTEGPLRDTHFMRTMGPRHIPLAFKATAEAHPEAMLVLNDYDLEYVGDRCDARRKVALQLVRQLQDNNIDIGAVGMQGHLYAELKIDVEGVGRFAEELKSLGVGLIISELDIIDRHIKGGAEEQDAAAMRSVSDLLDAVLPTNRPKAVITWGITDRYSWVPDVMPRTDGNPDRPLPLDRNYMPKGWYEMLRRRLAAA
ncbi:endo-1,4-beta-xylanase [Mangrovicella endophytica]|uniref:endo-1,4-beta-xylanase n=1 Tax=Mangrovicella endophytica TaxID=2066697 RepID=UPI001FE056BC|nr:endo-1,4-beta-xylanase [Mangrovicella endophytica]